MLESEFGELRAKLGGVFENLQAGNCTQIAAVHERLIALQAASEAHAKGLVADENFKLDETVEILIDPEKRGFPKTAEPSARALPAPRPLPDVELLGAGMKLPEAKKQLVASLRAAARKRARRSMKHDEVYARFLDAVRDRARPALRLLSPDDLEDFKIHMRLSLEGIGAVLRSEDGYTMIEESIPGGPADKHGSSSRMTRSSPVAQDEDGSRST